MDEKDNKSLTVGDILDQLVKPPITQSPPPQISKSEPVPSVNSPIKIEDIGGGLKIPVLGEDRKTLDTNSSTKELDRAEFPKEPVKIQLSIRTLADDIKRLRGGQESDSTEVEKTIILGAKPQEKALLSNEQIDTKIDKQQLLEDIKELPQSPKAPAALSEDDQLSRTKNIGLKIPFLGKDSEYNPIPLPSRPAHIHEEIQIADRDDLPPFPGAPIPKKAVKPKDEKVEYSAIMRVISSGMTTGIVSTVVIAIGIYFLLSFFIFNDEGGIFSNPTPPPTQEAPINQVNELEVIFKTVPITTFIIPSDIQKTNLEFNTFIDAEKIDNKNFKRVDIKTADSQVSELRFSDILKNFRINYPSELNNYIKDINMVFLYGQEEVFEEESNREIAKKRLVLIVEVNDTSQVLEVMKSWEATMANDLKILFNLDPSRQASAEFIDNERRGVMIRYKNFPLPDKSLDYSIVTSLTGRYYLIITNSRESMYSPADKIRGL